MATIQIATVSAPDKSIVGRALIVQHVDSETLIGELCALSVTQFLAAGYTLTRQDFDTQPPVAPITRIR